jgi:hypothetical protein
MADELKKEKEVYTPQVQQALDYTESFIKVACRPLINRPIIDTITKNKIIKMTKECVGEMIRMNEVACGAQMTLEEYFKKYYCGEEGWHQTHTIQARVEDGTVIIYIHPEGRNGDTLDFEIYGNALFEIPKEPSLAEEPDEDVGPH